MPFSFFDTERHGNELNHLELTVIEHVDQMLDK